MLRLLLVALCLFLCGCSGEDSVAFAPDVRPSPVASPLPVPLPSPSPGTSPLPLPSPTPTAGPVNFRFNLEVRPRQVPLYVTQLRFSARDSANNLVFGPLLRAKASDIVLTDVPTRATSIQVDYLAGETVVGLFRAPLSVPATFNDPDFVDVETLSSITVSPQGLLALGGTRQYLANGTFTDNRTYDLTTTVTWSSSNSTAANISRDGLATGNAAGATNITATLAGKMGSVPLIVGSGNLTSLALSPVNPSVARTGNQPFKATGTFQDGTPRDLTTQVTWSSSNTTVATITPQGVANGARFGNTTITASLGNVTASTNLSVTERVALNITVTPVNATVQKLGRLQYNANATFPGGTVENVTAEVTWSSTQPEFAAVTPEGIAVGLFVGNTTIEATLGGVKAGANLTVVDTATGGPLPTPAAGPARLYVGTADRISVYANPFTINGAPPPTATWTTGVNFASDVALDRTRDILYVANSGSGQISVFQPASTFPGGAPVRALTNLNNPNGVSIDAATDRLYVAATGSAQIFVVAAASSQSGDITLVPGLQTVTYGVGQPRGIDYDALTNRLYVAGSGPGSNFIDIFNIASTMSGVAGSPTAPRRRIFGGGVGLQIFFPLSVSIDGASQRLYVSDSVNGLFIFDNPFASATMAGAFINANTRITGVSANFSGLNGVYIDVPRDEVYVSDSGGSLFIFGPASTLPAGVIDPLPTRTIGPDFTNLNFPWGIDLGP